MKSAMRSAVIQTMQQTSESRKEHDRSNNGRADDGTSRAEDGTLRASLLHHAILLAEPHQWPCERSRARLPWRSGRTAVVNEGT